MRVIDKIVVSSTPPSKWHLWLHNGVLKMHANGVWQPVGGSSDSGDLSQKVSRLENIINEITETN